MNETVLASLDHLRPTMPWAEKAPTPEESEEHVRRTCAKWMTREDLGMGIWNLDETRFLGGTGLHRIDWNVPKFEIGYWIRPDEEGKGLVTETVRLLCALCFDTLGANRVLIRCASDNLRSAGVPKRVGFAFEGTHRNEIRSTDGELRDMLVFGMTPEMWAGRGG